MKRRELHWGESPWDKMTRKELLREVQRGYAAISSARGALAVLRQGNDEHPYWGDSGTGGRAMTRCDKVIDAAERKYTSGSIYQSFFRFATTLLFEERSRWVICSACGQAVMVIVGEGTASKVGKPCQDVFPFASNQCAGTMRWFGWEDFERKDGTDGA